MADEWKNLTDGSFKGLTFHVAVPSKNKAHGITSEDVTEERKLQVIDRPGMDGSGTNDFGRKGKVSTVEVVFFGPTYSDDLAAFEKKLNEGTPGLLTLPTEPESFIASFQKITKRSSSQGVNTKIVTVTWIEAEEKATVFVKDGSSIASSKTTVAESVTKTKLASAKATSVLKANPFLTALRTFESGLSVARSNVNTVLTLEQGVRSRITGLEANLNGTLALINEAADKLSALFVKKDEEVPTFSAEVDEVTGQRVADFSETDDIPENEDPLAPPVAESSAAVDTSSIQSEASAQLALSKLKDSIASDRDSLAEDTDGRTDDASRALTAVVNAIGDLSGSIKTRQSKTVLVPFEMSLMEVAYFNGRTVDDLDSVYGMNTHIVDPLVVPKDTVVVL